jgi:hypothetical protein
MKKEFIVCTPHTCVGQPRLEGHRLTVWDVVWGAVHYCPEDPLLYFREREEYGEGIDPELVRQAILYCRERRCLLKNAGIACAYCTLRFGKEEDTHDDEDTNGWEEAEKAYQLLKEAFRIPERCEDLFVDEEKA